MKKSSLLVFGVSAGALLLTACIKSSPPVPPDVVIASGAFADGFAVEILRAELTPKMSFQSARPAGVFEWAAKVNTGMTYAAGGIDLRMDFTNGAFTSAGLEVQNNSEPLLFVLLRAKNPDGTGLVNHDFLACGERYLMERKAGTTKIIDVSHPSDDPSKMELHLQVEDGAGGWRDLLGPIMPDTEDGRAFAVVDAFPRRKPDLRLRLLHLGQAPIEVTVPNPGYQAAFPILKPQSPPFVHEDEEFRLVSDGLKWQRNPQRRSALDFTVKVEAPSLPKDCLQARVVLFDETGNRLMWKAGKFFGFHPLPGEKNYLVRCSVEREETIYPWRENEVTFLAEGILAADPKLQTATITAGGENLGCKTITFKQPDPSKTSWRFKKPILLNFEIQGECAESALNEMQRDYAFGHLVVFVNGGRSEGVCDHPNWTHSTNLRENSTFEFHSTWAGDLKPGDPFRIALIKKHVPEVIEFVLEVPEKPEAAQK